VKELTQENNSLLAKYREILGRMKELERDNDQ
jgi:hypothetical protein